MKCINCTKFIQCSLDKQADENKKECIYFIHREEEIEHIKIGNIPIQDYGTPFSRSCYSENYNLKFGETINMREEEIERKKK